ncbi:porin family protein [Pseudooceanicola algae]|nr:hypothetical protein [Pseudooceanicola algae]
MRKRLVTPPSPVARRAVCLAMVAGCFASGATAQVAAPETPAEALGEDFVNTTELATPDAQEVILDLPSALHSSLYQRGTLGQWVYVIYPDGSAKIMDDSERSQVRADLVCEAAVSCLVSKTDGTDFEVPVGLGERPDAPQDMDLDNVARYLSEWILAGTAPPSALVEAEPVVDEPAPVAPETQPAPELVAEESEAEASPAPDETADQVAAGATLVASVEAALADADVGPVCSEAEPFVPTDCSQPTEPMKPEVVAVAQPKRAARKPAPVAPAKTPDPVEPVQPEAVRQERLVDKYRVNCSVSTTSGLGFLTRNAHERRDAKARVSLGCSAALHEKVTVRLSLIRYLVPSEQDPWDPDYTYAFVYRMTDKITLGYSNYSARFTDGGNPVDGLFGGDFRGSYKLPAIPLPNDKTIPCVASIGLPDPTDQSLNLSCGYAVTKKLRVNMAAYFYTPGGQDTYEPDYSYTASYRINDDWLVSYSNYSNNRWPWNEGSSPGPGLTGGNVSLTYRFTF